MLATFMSIGPSQAFGFQLGPADPDRVDISWTTDERHLQAYGDVHGGVYCAVVETAGSIGGGLWYSEQEKVVGLPTTPISFAPPPRRRPA